MVTGRGLTLQQVADHNSRVTLEALRRDGPLTRKELAEKAGLTAPGVSNIVRKLAADGLVIAQEQKLANGRPGAAQYGLRAQGAFSIGVRLGSGFGEAVLLDLAGSVWGLQAFEFDGAPERALAASLDVLKKGMPTGALMSGVGIALAPTQLSFEGDGLQGEIDSPCMLTDSDTTAAVLAERVLGVGPVGGGFMYVLVSDTVRVGFLLKDKPFSGVHGQAGQIGKMRTGSDHLSVDDAAGLNALVAAIGAAEVSRLSAGGDLQPSPKTKAWVEKAARHLLDAIVATAGFLAPGLALVGGDLPAPINDLLVAQIRQLSAEYAKSPFSSPWMPEIRSASFDRAGIAIGAGLLPFFETLLPSPFHGDPAQSV